MSSTSQPKDFSDLYTDLQNRVRASTGITATETQAKRYINIALQDMHLGSGEKFGWAERNSILRTRSNYSTGTVSVTQGSATLTGSSTLWSTNDSFGVANARRGGKIILSSSPIIYEVTSVASDTSLTLSTAFIGDTESGLSYIYFEDEFDLASDFLRPLDLEKFSDSLDLWLMSRIAFRRVTPNRRVTGRPQFCCLMDRPPVGNTTPRRRLRLDKDPNYVYLIPYAYVTSQLVVTAAGAAATDFVNDTDEPLVPLNYRHGIILHALKSWYRDKKDDARSAEVSAEYTDFLLRVNSDTEIGGNRARINTDLGRFFRAARTPYRRGYRGR